MLKRLNSAEVPGVTFRPATFRPTFQKFADQICAGFQLHVTDRSRFRPVRTTLALLAAIRAEATDQFRWRTERYEFVDDKPAIDLLFGSDRERLALDAGESASTIARRWEPEEAAFQSRCAPHLLY